MWTDEIKRVRRLLLLTSLIIPSVRAMHFCTEQSLSDAASTTRAVERFVPAAGDAYQRAFEAAAS